MYVQFRLNVWRIKDDETAKLIEEAIGQKLERDEEGKIKSSYNVYTADMLQIMKFANVVELQQVDNHWMFNLIEKIESMEEKFNRFTASQSFNERCSVHVPGFAMMEIRKVKVEIDYCTDRLQDDLNDGWRILAICPQPDQRRPDYILGRTQ